MLALAVACTRDAAPNQSTASTASRPSLTTTDVSDGCTQIRGARPDTSLNGADTAALRAWYLALARGTEYLCRIHASMPDLRIAIAFDTNAGGIDTIIVYRDSASTRPLQVIGVVESRTPSPARRDLLRAIDVDDDGYRDLIIGKTWGATGNTDYDVWRWDRAGSRFVRDEELADATNVRPIPGRPCIAASNNTSVQDDAMSVLCLRGGHWVVDSTETHRWDRVAHQVVYEVRARRGDSLVVVRRETKPEEK